MPILEHRDEIGVLLIQGHQSLLRDPTLWTNVTDKKAQSAISRWLIAAAAFGAVCNLLCWGLSNYQSFYLKQDRLIWDYSFIIVECLMLAPLLVLFILCRFAPVVFPCASALFLILMGRVYQLIQYHKFGVVALVQKIDSPSLFLIFLGGISIAVVLVWAAIHFVVFIRHAPKSDGPAS